MATRDSNTDDSAGYPVGNRTERPHSPSGWFPGRPADDESTGDMPARGTVGRGTHDRPKKN